MSHPHLDLLEPVLKEVDPTRLTPNDVLFSAAVSLKRIADALSYPNPHPTHMNLVDLVAELVRKD